MKSVDIIVPVYNAYEYTEECIKSIIKNTDLNLHTLVLINDKSPDEKILPMLLKYKADNKEKQIVVLDNEINLGFVKTVNKGMQYSTNDVILLNSDTEVTKNWIEKIQECAYSNKYIASVTPLTNNGTIASVPNFGQDNELPEEMTLNEYAEMIEKVSANRYPEITTGNGYCMYIKRDVISELGLFDDETFGKGYGEENDFCYRALDHGYTHVLCDNTFIYHKGTQSFKKENLTASRAALIDEHMNLLRKKHPIYVQKTDNFLAKNPLIDIHENINLNIVLHGKKKILYLINEWEENMDMTGGASLHLKDIIKANMKNNIASFVLAPDKFDLSRFKLYLYTDKYQRVIANYKTDMNFYGQITYTNNSYREMIENLFDSFKFDILHVHHFLFQSFDAIEIAKERNVYSIITLHDLYMKCPSINMVYIDKYCDYDERKDCSKCLHNRYGVNSNVLENWQKTCKNVLDKFDKIIVPSENTKNIFDEVYKGLDIEVVVHGVNVVKVKQKENQEEKNKNEFNIAFVGAMAIHKGTNILKDFIKNNNNSNIKIHLFGKPNDSFLEKSSGTYTNHGPYTRGELPQLLVDHNIDLVCIFATWPETYSYTLTECYMAEIPIITFDIGAVGDRVKKDKLGWVIDFTTDSKEILTKISEISKNTEEYQSIKDNFKKYTFKTIEEMQEYYEDLYVKIKTENQQLDIYRFMNHREKTQVFDLQQYQLTYGHVVHKYEKLRSTKLWKVAKRIKALLRHQ